MGELVELVLVIVAVAIVVMFSVRGRGRSGGEAREQLVERRVGAYMQTIRREGRNPQLVAMTDGELRDVLLAAAHTLKVQGERKLYALGGAALAALVAAIVAATQDGLRGFAITVVVGALIIYGLNEYLDRRMREPLVRQGIDIDRLRVD